MPLHTILGDGASLDPAKPAVIHPGRAALTYAELTDLSDRLSAFLARAGVRPGDRVGVYLHKSVDAVAAMFGILKAGAAYVPVDADAPIERCAYVLNDCSVRAVLCKASLAGALRTELAELGSNPYIAILEDAGLAAVPLAALLEDQPGGLRERDPPNPEELAYILYTSGSTGRPKGVMLSHRAALSFVDWCSDTFEPTPEDRFSSHAPFHFDLSILDIFVPLKHGATLVLIDEKVGKDPLTLAPLIAEEGITVWYSTPSILNLLAQYGKLERYDYGRLRLVLFAGEVFPIPQLRALVERWPRPRYFNLYGPTETNVCTYYELPAHVEPARKDPFPIGRTCEHLVGQVVDADGMPVAGEAPGELVIAGSGVMSGYWNLPEQNRRAFLVDENGQRWYRTGDIVARNAAGDYVFHGRRDRMVKRHGYRIELGDIEAGLSRHSAVREVAVIADADERGGTRIRAFLRVDDERRPSIIDLKRHCADALPRYMIPDAFNFLDALPRTSTDKIDYRALTAQTAR